MIRPVLMAVSGICWSVTYVSLIRNGFRDRTCGMPLFALGLNICWEVLYAFYGFTAEPSGIQTWINMIWACLDIAIIVTWMRYGRALLPAPARRHFIAFTMLTLITCAMAQLAFYLRFDNAVEASQYSAFAQNAVMSVLFLTHLWNRGDGRGQTMTMAVAKCLGTLAPTILGGLIESLNVYILLMGAICLIFDLLYIGQLYALRHKTTDDLIQKEHDDQHPVRQRASE
ncbi:hypothetical protein JS528_06700 [Bifidobacterium sp. MA2]|uniref:Uncharacterized protein n=1 Tax=Bifidobacterium santillanense TaxID=2809028 RepID=A0ABS5UQ27_9BIFI|nr:hypothetical protein [Bifidobacterium santillanense]MBT1173046.1 hypothetical protein [Bifidobacterium santillanense]